MKFIHTQPQNFMPTIKDKVSTDYNPLKDMCYAVLSAQAAAAAKAEPAATPAAKAAAAKAAAAKPAARRVDSDS